MGKSASKIMEVLTVPLQPIRYMVTNTEKIILVTYDYKYAQFIANTIKKLDKPANFYLRINTK